MLVYRQPLIGVSHGPSRYHRYPKMHKPHGRESVQRRLVKVLLTVFCTLCTIRMGLSIICFKGAQVDYPNKCVLQSMNIAFIIANGADPDEMQQTTKLPFQGFPGSIQEGLDGV